MSNPALILNVYPHGDGWEVRVGPSRIPGEPYKSFYFGTVETLAEWMRVYATYRTRRMLEKANA